MNLYLVLRQNIDDDYADELVAICTNESDARLHVDSPNYDIKIIMIRLTENGQYIHDESFYTTIVE